MAIYYLDVKIIQRSRGRSAIAAAAYRRATKLYAEKEERYWNYKKKPNVVHSEVMVSEDAPLWAKALVSLHETMPSQAAEVLWNKVEAAEKRVDAQLAREVLFALPRELTTAQNILLARRFIQEQFVSLGMIADWNLHEDPGNPHVHVMLTMRTVEPEGFGKRVLEWNRKKWLYTWREKWSEYANWYLQTHRIDARIDHRSYAAQGIALVPGIHHGRAVLEMADRGIETDVMFEANAIREENLKRIAAQPRIILDKLSAHSESFTRQQLGQELGRYVNDRGLFSCQVDTVQRNASETLAERAMLSASLLRGLSTAETAERTVDCLTSETIAQILVSLEHHDSVFSEAAIAKAVAPFTEYADLFARAMLQIKASPELLYLGAGEDGRDRFTTRKMFALENDLQARADTLRERRHVKLPTPFIRKALTDYERYTSKTLTEEQRLAAEHILQPAALRCVVGRAGTGKSFLLGAARAVWEARGLRVKGIALSGIAADGLSKDAGIPSRTIASFCYQVEQGMLRLTPYDVVVMDEAGMTDSVSMQAVLKAVEAAGAKLVLVGDHAQLQPVGPGAAFRSLLERLGFAELHTIYRQKAPWQQAATVALSAGRVAEALAVYDAEGCLHIAADSVSAMTSLVQDWSAFRYQGLKDISQTVVIAHRNSDVATLNDLLRAARVAAQEIAEGYRVKTAAGEICIASGDRLLFLKNDARLGVSNGRFATVQGVKFTESGRVMNFTVLLDGQETALSIDPTTYNHFSYGYAATVHKVQGMTVDHAWVYVGGSLWNRYLTTVALTRHRETCHCYADEATHGDRQALERRLSRFGLKDSVLDFPLAFAERRGIDSASREASWTAHLAERLRVWKEKCAEQYAQSAHPNDFAAQRHAEAEQRLREEKDRERREDARLVAAYVDANKDVGMTWQGLLAKLEKLGLSGMTYAAPDFAVIAGTNAYADFQAALALRNQKAFEIGQDPARYALALAIYALDGKPLALQAERHRCLVRVQAYVAACARGAVVQRDRFAVEIAQDRKAHYPFLQALHCDGRLLNTHAVAHLRRQLFIQLTPTQRAAFRVVAEYQAQTQEIAALWGSHQGKLFQHSVWKRLDRWSRQRDRLAEQILADPAAYRIALDFYQIGSATPRWGKEPTAQQVEQAKLRFQRLQQAAVRHEIRERVLLYHRALFLGDLRQRLPLAHAIVQDAKAHHGAVLGLGANTSELWRAIRQDADRFTRAEDYHRLAIEERAGFRVVAAYVEAKQAHARAWRELFETRQTAGLSEQTLYALAASHVASTTQTRNRLAQQIVTELARHQAGLAYFKLGIDELQPEATAHQCGLNVAAYQQAAQPLARSYAALALIADPKAHHSALMQQGLAWRQVYTDARLAQRDLATI